MWRTAEISNDGACMHVWDNNHENIIGVLNHGDMVTVVLSQKSIQGQVVNRGEGDWIIQTRNMGVIPYPPGEGWLIDI